MTEDIAEPVQIQDRVSERVPKTLVSSMPTYASVAEGYVAEDITELVQIEKRVRDGILDIFVSSLSTYALQCTKYKWRPAETEFLPYL
jgi:hypothetical protein